MAASRITYGVRMMDRFSVKFIGVVPLQDVGRPVFALKLLVASTWCSLRKHMNQKVSGYSSALLMLNVPSPSIGLTEGRTPVDFVVACTYPCIVLTMGTLKALLAA